jgi:hypothetical protein
VVDSEADDFPVNTIDHNVHFTLAEAEAAGMLKENDFKPTQEVASILDQGVDLSTIFTTDFEGKTRPVGAGWDIGPYEFGAAGILKKQYPISNAQYPMSNEKLQHGMYDLTGRIITGKRIKSGIYMVSTGSELRKTFIIK